MAIDRPPAPCLTTDQMLTVIEFEFGTPAFEEAES